MGQEVHSLGQVLGQSSWAQLQLHKLVMMELVVLKEGSRFAVQADMWMLGSVVNCLVRGQEESKLVLGQEKSSLLLGPEENSLVMGQQRNSLAVSQEKSRLVE